VNLASNRNYNHGAVIIGFIGYKQGAFAPKRTWGPLIFISKFNFLYYNQSIGKVSQKSQCRFYFSGMTLKRKVGRRKRSLYEDINISLPP